MNNANLIGLTSDKYNEKSDAGVFFKRQALLFDRIAVLNLKSLIGTHSTGNSDTGKSFAADLEWLTDQEVIFDPETPHPQAFFNDPESLTKKLSNLNLDSNSINLITQASTDSEELFEAAEVLIAKISEGGSLPVGDTETKNQAHAFLQAYKTQSASELRYAVQWLRLVNGKNAVLAHSLDDCRDALHVAFAGRSTCPEAPDLQRLDFLAVPARPRRLGDSGQLEEMKTRLQTDTAGRRGLHSTLDALLPAILDCTFKVEL